MEFQDTLKSPKGHWKLDVYEGDSKEKLLQTIEGDNLIVTAGKDLLLDRLFALNGPPAAIGSVGVGDNATAAAVGDTGLKGTTNVLIQTADAGTSRSAEVVTIKSTFGTGVANFNWQELGLFNGNVNNTSTMLNRIAPIGPFNKTSAVSIIVTVTITQS
jgi:hypothetical protein